MKPIESDMLMAALAEALETMAFIAAEPGEALPADDGLTISLAFTGQVNGSLSLSTPVALGTVIAANLAAIEVDAVSPEHSFDALRELANVTTGLLLRQVCTPEEMPQMGIPRISPHTLSEGDNSACRAFLLADSMPVGISVRISA